MKKKLIPLSLALVCALSCAAPLAACGEDEKFHSAEQWSAAFADQSTRECFSFSENPASYNYTVNVLEYDKNIGYYSYRYFTPKITDTDVSFDTKGKTIFKKGNYYYVDPAEDTSNRAYELSSDDAAAEINGNSSISLAGKILDLCKDKYDDYEPYGSGSSNAMNYHTYRTTNVSFRIDENHNILLEEVKVSLDDKNASLYEIIATFEKEDIAKKDHSKAKYEYTYRNVDSYAISAGYCEAPDRLEGKTFKLVDMWVEDPEHETSYYDDYKNGILAQTKDKTITAKADGTLEGDIVIGEIAVNTMKYTEDFLHQSTYGDVTISNAHISGLTEQQKVTLTGNIASGFNGWGSGDESYDAVFELTLRQGNIEFTYHFALV